MPRIPTAAILLLPLLSIATIAFADAGVPHDIEEGVANQGSTTTIGDTYAYGETSENGNQFSWAVMSANANGQMSLSDLEFSDRLDDLQKEADRNGHGVFWFRLDGRPYLVTDPVFVKDALELVGPMAEIGKKQGEYGAKMGEIGAHMGELGALQGRVGALRAQIGLHRAGSEKAKGDLDELERELDQLQDEIRDLRDEQRDMMREQKELGVKQKAFGKQQKAALKGAQNGLRDLAKKAIADGKAVRDRD